jgi:hypothetical protein
MDDAGFADWTPFDAGVAATAAWAQSRLEVTR